MCRAALFSYVVIVLGTGDGGGGGGPHVFHAQTQVNWSVNLLFTIFLLYGLSRSGRLFHNSPAHSLTDSPQVYNLYKYYNSL